MAALLNSRPETQGFQIGAAVAGKSIVAYSHTAKKRYSDLLLYGQRGQDKIVIAIEAVADQPSVTPSRTRDAGGWNPITRVRR